MPKNKRFQKPFTKRSYYNATTHVPHFEIINVEGRESGIQCRQCTRILTYYHSQPGDLCPICRKLDRNSKIRRLKRQGPAPQLGSSNKAPTHIKKRSGNIFQINSSHPQERFPVTESSEQMVDDSYSVEDDPNYFSFENSYRNDNFKFDNDLQISSRSNQVSRSVQLKQKDQEALNSPIQQLYVNHPILNEVQTFVNSATPSDKRGIKRKEIFENVSLKRLRPNLVVSPVPIDYELTRSICQYYAENAQTDEVFYSKMELRDRLENIVQERFPGSELFIFGSSMTGYGSKTCDVDVCLMFHDLQIQQKKALSILWELKKLLSRKYFFIKLQVIRARVPILKFKDSYSGFDVDLNINNPTGIRNSQLLRSYARIDDRVRPLILAIKLWARSHDINDAKSGSLSSYCLGLMLIHYLQYRCSPPVLPCLQTLQPDKYLPDADVRTLKMDEVLPFFRSNNNQSVGNLFAGFIRYYSTEYDYLGSRISVRLGCLLPRVEKQNKKNKLLRWIDIEEPFEQTNAARAANSPKVQAYMKSVFDSSCSRLNECGNIFTLCS